MIDEEYKKIGNRVVISDEWLDRVSYDGTVSNRERHGSEYWADQSKVWSIVELYSPGIGTFKCALVLDLDKNILSNGSVYGEVVFNDEMADPYINKETLDKINSDIIDMLKLLV